MKIFIGKTPHRGVLLEKWRPSVLESLGSTFFFSFVLQNCTALYSLTFSKKSNFVNGALKCSDEVITDKGTETKMLQWKMGHVKENWFVIIKYGQGSIKQCVYRRLSFAPFYICPQPEGTISCQKCLCMLICQHLFNVKLYQRVQSPFGL